MDVYPERGHSAVERNQPYCIANDPLVEAAVMLKNGIATRENHITNAFPTYILRNHQDLAYVSFKFKPKLLRLPHPSKTRVLVLKSKMEERKSWASSQTTKTHHALSNA